MDGNRPRRALLTAIALLMLAGCGGGAGSSGQPQGSSSPQGGKEGASQTINWPYFGRVPERTHYIAEAPDPPFKFEWQFWAHQLIEFPPAVAGGHLYVLNKSGEVYAVRTDDGKLAWKRNLGNDVTGPAYGQGAVYVAQLGGSFAALDAASGKVRWSFHAPSKLESSPLALGGRVYFGSDGGMLYALDAKSGKLAWKRDLGAPIKASPTYHDGVLYVGDYDGRIHAVAAASGVPRWTVDTHAPSGRGGGFYSSPAVAFGNVYEARAEGTVFAVTLSGHQRWSFNASNDIYASPALADIPGTGPTLFIGSYNHQLYALNARNGKKRWSYDVGGQVPGSPTVVGKTVYTSSFDTGKTVGLDAGTGKPIWEWGTAGYEPMVSDGNHIFLTGFQSIWAFGPCAPKSKEQSPSTAPICQRAADLHLVAVQRTLRREKPKSSAAR